MISATLDTNVYIKAINFRGPASILLGHAKAGNFRLDISNAILDEISEVLRRKFHLNPHTLHSTLENLQFVGHHVSPTETLRVERDDPDDDESSNAP